MEKESTSELNCGMKRLPGKVNGVYGTKKGQEDAGKALQEDDVSLAKLSKAKGGFLKVVRLTAAGFSTQHMFSHHLMAGSVPGSRCGKWKITETLTCSSPKSG